MPLLRYEVGDLAEVDADPEPCACGRAMPRVRRISGRQDDVVIAPDGRVITTLFIVFNQVAGIAQGQVIQEEPNQLRVRLVRTPMYTDRSEAEFLHYLRRFIGPDMKVQFEYVSHQALRRETNGKFRTIISRIHKDPQPAVPREFAHLHRGD
jgi:phenylacetate-CoA ligase